MILTPGDPPREPTAPGTVGPVVDLEYLDAVLELVEQVPAGRATTYGILAEAVGHGLGRGGPRQVGAVMAHAGGGVPWWRVVNASGCPPARCLDEALARLRADDCPLRGDRVDLRRAVWLPPLEPTTA
ncbi:Alkylated DNA nucleotide flippase Atl1, participates in nucleotide excision repair, Ada-like DNA-binding domain [Paraoerskovia marina]|uniref:Alkylated DNA nucleotide flippase Atl1, participates in nucleotide excision repair, Ada-like DNA-binding domain n=1 Tax=Paraoerskovia marina TaxID=545619 RepID=A0A1H1U9T4_9CELL|nr:Alkylated DNA nucleotide flippase Atl1, participates in nucleotide excision repair, Ada-like DNA-binding domain [Paraoerskovia marina]